ncbi:MAG TPA: hypothetical protein VMJ34_03010 [Bryobacteraceae bacterium]|nr:hypothetical protein [Bryobacteraceae bacterium]
MKRVWRFLLRLYPAAYRETFAAEMESVFDQAAEDHRQRGRLAYLAFAGGEIIGLLAGAAAQSIPRRGVVVVAGGVSTEVLIERNLRRMEHAIATHQFEKARFYARVDDELRARRDREAA